MPEVLARRDLLVDLEKQAKALGLAVHEDEEQQGCGGEVEIDWGEVVVRRSQGHLSDVVSLDENAIERFIFARLPSSAAGAFHRQH